MTPRWAPEVAPGALAQYVYRGVVASLLPRELAEQLSGPSDEPPMRRAQRVYEVLAQRGISYVREPTSSEAGRQAIRPPDEVLAGPRQATCLDMAVTFCGACLDAGLHPLVVVLKAPGGGVAHAVVLVRLDTAWSDATARNDLRRPVVHESPPAELDGELRVAENQPGRFLAVDATGAAHPPDGAQLSWEQAVRRGTELVSSALDGAGTWQWATAVDVGASWRAADVHPLRYWPQTAPIVEPYLAPDPDAGPLMQLRARRSVVKFYPRDELDLLLDWCQAPDPETRTRIAVVHGVGGAGKTHLAAELAHRLAEQNWYAGFLTRDAAPEDLAWLAKVVPSLLVVVDYPEDVRAATVLSLLKALRDREAPACVILTARTLGTWWTDDILAALTRDGVPYLPFPPLELPRRHPSTTGVFQRALRAFAQLPGMTAAEVTTPPPDQRWTTLDLIMLAWLAAHGAAALPTTPARLYDEILDREFDFWRRVYLHQGLPEPPPRLLPAVGACITLLAPTPQRLATTLRAVEAFDGENKWRQEVAAVLGTLLPPDSETGTVTIRPDPVGERLVLRQMGADREVLGRCLDTANDEERLNACVAITRALERDEPAAAALSAAVLSAKPDMWRPALTVVAARGGPFAAPLLALADRDDSPLPLDQLSESIPVGHSTLRTLALIATQRSRPSDTADPADLDGLRRLAMWWNKLASRQDDVGDWRSALDSITEAVTHCRQLVEGEPNAILDLVLSLNNLSLLQSRAGHRAKALESITEAATHCRKLIRTNAPSVRPYLALTLNTLSVQQAENGDRTAGLRTSTEAIEHYRQLAETNRAEYLPGLAAALRNLSVQQAENGERAAALDTGIQAVAIFRQLVQADPNAYLPDLAMSLNNLSSDQADNGDHVAALDSITEAVAIRRWLVRSNPVVFLPDLAISLSNLSNRQGKNGNPDRALDSITEAVTYYRQIVQINRAAFLPELAGALTTLSLWQAGSGQRNKALDSINEAVAIRRQLVQVNRAAFLPGLAVALINLAAQQTKIGGHTEAIRATTEAIAILRQLVETNRGAYLPELATALGNFATQRAEIGERTAALETITEAVELLRELADTNPAAYLPNFALALDALSVRRADTGDRTGALAASTQAAAIHRQLAQVSPVPFLPDLAGSLTKLSDHQAECGDRAGALDSITEAVGYCRQLALSNRAAYLPELARALNSLSLRQAAVGNRAEGLDSATESVTHYRQLALANPGAYLPGLATSLNTLSLQRAETKDRTGALDSITEAVTIRRQLATPLPSPTSPISPRR